MTVRALLVDDNPDTRAIVALALDLHPDFVVTAASRVDAAERLRRGHETFDVILLDAKLIDLSPGALVTTMRQWPASATVPILILSPKATEIRSVGAQGLIAKPFDPIALPDRVLAILEPLRPERRQSAG